MKYPTFKLLIGRKTLNDWFDIWFMISNHVDFKISIFGYGFKFNWVIKEPQVELREGEN